MDIHHVNVRIVLEKDVIEIRSFVILGKFIMIFERGWGNEH
mgnify:CR=1 FL=1|jgi:hypothetical protein